MQQAGGDEANAGAFDYRGFDPGSLSIVGAGTPGRSRNVHIWDTLSVGAGAPPSGVAVLVGGSVQITGSGNKVIFPDGTVQTTAGITAGGTYSNSSVSGTYVFSYTTVGPLSGSLPVWIGNGHGYFVANGQGNLSGRYEEYLSTDYCTGSVTGTYSVSAGSTTWTYAPSSGSGKSCTAGTKTLRIDVGLSGNAVVFAESDGAGWVSGTALKQQPLQIN
jgi:hypothetical protein